MFMCKECLEQFEDSQLAYTLIPENRLSHPSADTFVYKFCSRAHLRDFLSKISYQRQKYILTQYGKNGPEPFPSDYPLELLLQVGSLQRV